MRNYYRGYGRTTRRSPKEMAEARAAAPKITQVRGICPFCGNEQSVDKKEERRMVLHGYTRPGDGMVYGRCPGAKIEALNFSSTPTARWLMQYREQAARLRLEVTALEAAAMAANKVYAAAPEERDAGYTRPRQVASWKRTPETTAQYEAARRAWEAKYPKYLASIAAERAAGQARIAMRMAIQTADHLSELLKRAIAGITGSPLKRVEVAKV